ncbi:MAG: ATP-binding protein, partial [Desulfuromonadaceae bacterium]
MPEHHTVPRFLKLPFALGVALLYAIVALFWIYFSDRLILVLAQTQDQLLLYSTFKGWGYVLLTAALLFLVLRRFVTKIRESQQQLLNAAERYSTILRSIGDAVIVADTTGRIELMNPVAEKLCGLSESQAQGVELDEVCNLVDEATRVHIPNPALRALQSGEIVTLDQNTLLVSRDVDGLPISDTAAPIKNPDGTLAGAVLVFRDQSEERHAQRKLEKSYQSLKTIMDSMDAAIYIADFGTHEILFVNKELRRRFGDSVVGKPCWQVLQGESKACSFCNNADLLDAEGNPVGVVHSEFQNKINKKWYDIRDQAITWFDGRLVRLEVAVDITERKELEQQLLQAQKLESIGRLAGGVAHDYNNMLGVILGSAELALNSVTPDHPVHAKLEQIRSAARRSADITRQLLAFARKQTVAPKVIELNTSLEGMLKMLHRLIGEEIDLSWRPGTNLDPVEIDPVQLDQLLANLCVNARDAISGSGKITIETANVEFDATYCARHQGFKPGHYVMLAVSDNGCGMDKETQANIYEPFFTTKDTGKGTGLGLATVYGIVKQNQGFINLYSEPGSGTTFRIYLPRHAEEITTQSTTEQSPAL